MRTGATASSAGQGAATALAVAARLLPPGFMAVGSALLLLLLLYTLPLKASYDVGSGPTPLTGLHGDQQEVGVTYAYSEGATSLTLPLAGIGRYSAELRLAGPGGHPVTATLAVGSQQLDLGMLTAPRRYRLLAPGGADGALQLRLVSQTIVPPGEDRTLGALVDRVTLQSYDVVLPGAPLAGLVAGTATLLYAAGLSLQLRRASLAAAVAFLGAAAVILLAWLRRTLDTPGALWPLDRALLVIGAAGLAWRPARALALRIHARPSLHTGMLVTMGLAAVALFAWQIARYAGFLIDDTYISLVYVKNLLAGRGLTFNGTAVAGYSNFLWVLGAAGLGALGLDLVLAVKLLGVACAVGVLLLLPAISRRMAGGLAGGLFAALLLALSTPFAVWSVAGLESQGFALLLLASIALMVIEEERGRVRLSVLPLLGLCLMRPEGFAMAAGLLCLWGAWRLWRRGRAALSRDYLSSAAAVLAGYGLFVGWHTLYYGYPMPTTVYAKTGNTARQIADGLAYLGRYAALVQPLPVLALLSAPLALRRLELAAVLVAASALAYTAFIILAGGDWMPAFRFVVPALPLYALTLGSAAAEIGSVIGRRDRGAGLLAAALVGALALWGTWRGEAALSAHVQATAGDVRNAERLAAFIAPHLTPGATVAVLDAGAIPYYTGAPTIDMVGLNDFHIASLPGGFMEKYDNDYVLARQPSFVQIHMGSTDEVLHPVNFPGTIRLYYMPEFRRWYEPSPERHDLFRRREAPLSDQELRQFFGAEIVARPPAAVRAGERLTLMLQLRNTGELPWHHSAQSAVGLVGVVIEWRDASGALIDESRARLKAPVLPGKSAELSLEITAPRKPGPHTLTIQLERTYLYHFSTLGVEPVVTPVEVRPATP